MSQRPLILLALALLPAACTRVPDHGIELVYAVDAAAVAETESVLTKRLASFDIRGAQVKARVDGVAVRVPGISNVRALRSILEREGRLEVAVVDDAGEVARPSELPAGIGIRDERVGDSRSTYLWAADSATMEAALPALSQGLPKDRALKLETSSDPQAAGVRTYLVEAAAWPMGKHLAEVEAREDEMGSWTINLTFDAAGKQAFGELTERSVRRRIAILLDDRVQSAPIVMEPIRGGNARMTLSSGRDPTEQRAEAESLAHVLRGGALPAPLRLVSEKAYGPKR